MTDLALQETWRQRLEGFEQSGMSSADWCSAKGISLNRFYHWRRRFREEAAQPPTAAREWAVLQLKSSVPAISVRVGAATVDVRPGFDPARTRSLPLAFLLPGRADAHR